MKKLPSDVDRLMWDIVESRDPRAIDEFGRRFPDLITELGGRLAAMENLQRAKSSTRTTYKPRFTPTTKFESSGPSFVKITSWVAGLAVATALSFAATRLIFFASPNRPQNVAPPSPTHHIEQPIVHQTPSIQTPIVDKPVAPTPSQENPSEAAVESAGDKPIKEFRMEKASLKVALLALADEGKLNLQFAPGMPDFNIRFDYRNASPRQIIDDLGKTFSFTALAQSKDSYVLIPARDPNAADQLPILGSAVKLPVQGPKPTSGLNGNGDDRSAQPIQKRPDGGPNIGSTGNIQLGR